MGRKLLLALLCLAPLGFFFFLRGTDKPIEPKVIPQSPLTKDEHYVMGCLAITPLQSFPGAMPWGPFFEVCQQETKALEELAERDPVAFLEKCLQRYESEIKGYRCYFDKQERVKGKLLHKEVVLVNFREKPFSVHMDWKESKGIIPVRTLYVEGENDGMMVVRPFHPLVPLKHASINHPDALATSRFPITHFGLGAGARNTLKSMYKARENGTLYLTYEGKVKVKEAGDRLCYKFIRAPQVPTEEDDINELIIYVDAETQLQVGSVLLDSKGELIAQYFFRNIEPNPKFDAIQFTVKSL